MTRTLNRLGERTDDGGRSGAGRLKAALATLGVVALLAGCGGSSGGGVPYGAGGSSDYDDDMYDDMSGSRTGTGPAGGLPRAGEGLGSDDGPLSGGDASEGGDGSGDGNGDGSGGDGGS